VCGECPDTSANSINGERYMNRNDEHAIEAAFRWHPDWCRAYRAGSLDPEDERHLVVHAAVEGMLHGDPKLAAVAREAEQDGVDPHEVRHCLGRAFLAGLWYHAQEGTGYDAEEMADRFVGELKRSRG
jgi:hypothetical protein